MNGIPRSIKDIVQFGPTEKNPRYLGVLGWGFNHGQYRIVMYAPPELDAPEVKDFYINSKRIRPDVGDDAHDDHVTRRRNRRQKLDKSQQFTQPMRRHEFPPAHIHVFHVPDGRESRFELVENYKGDDFTQYLLGKDGLDTKVNHKLNAKQIAEIQPVLDQVAPVFIQLWREMYVDKRVGMCVTRLSDSPHGEVRERIGSDGWLVQKNLETDRSVSFPPPNLENGHTGKITRDGDKRRR